MTINHKATRQPLVAIGLLSLSFWSSGIFLVRALAAYDVWSTPLFVTLLFALSIPIAHITILGTRHILKSPQKTILSILAMVMALHSLTLTLIPHLYALDQNMQLPATAWLLWFSGAALVSIFYTEPPHRST